MSKDMYVLALAKGVERYVFVFHSEYRAEVIRILARFASNPELNFSWYDAAVLTQRVRQGNPKSDSRDSLPKFYPEKRFGGLAT